MTVDSFNTALSMEIILVNIKIGCAFVPKFYHEIFINILNVLEYGPDNVRCEYPEI